MNVIKEMKEINSKNFNKGDIVVLTEIDEEYNVSSFNIGDECEIMFTINKIPNYEEVCKVNALSYCNKTSKEKCIYLQSMKNKDFHIWSCYVNFKKK